MAVEVKTVNQSIVLLASHPTLKYNRIINRLIINKNLFLLNYSTCQYQYIINFKNQKFETQNLQTSKR